MVPGFPPFDPHDFGHDDPGFFALGSDRAADFPAGTSPLPAGASVTVHFPELHRRRPHRHAVLLERHRRRELPADLTSRNPAFAIAIGANPLGPTSSPNPPTDTSFGALHEHPGFTIDNGGPGTASRRRVPKRCQLSVTGLTDSKNFYMVWVIDSLINDGDKADDLRDALLEHAAAPIVEGKDFTFVNNAIAYVQSNLVAVPEPSTAARVLITPLPFREGQGEGSLREPSR